METSIVFSCTSYYVYYGAFDITILLKEGCERGAISFVQSVVICDFPSIRYKMIKTRDHQLSIYKEN